MKALSRLVERVLSIALCHS